MGEQVFAVGFRKDELDFLRKAVVRLMQTMSEQETYDSLAMATNVKIILDNAQLIKPKDSQITKGRKKCESI